MGRKSRTGVYWDTLSAKGEKVPELFIVELPQMKLAVKRQVMRR